MYGFANSFEKTLSNKYTCQSHMDRWKVYKGHLKSNCIDDEFKQHLKRDILNEVKLFFDALGYDVVNVKQTTALNNLIISR